MRVHTPATAHISPTEIRALARCDPGGIATGYAALYLFTDDGDISINLWPADARRDDPHAPERRLIELRHQIDAAIESAQQALRATRPTS